MQEIFSCLFVDLALSGTLIYAGGDEEDQLLKTNSCVNYDLNNAWLEKANLRKTDLSGANLYRANMEYSDLRGPNLTSADLIGASLKGDKLRDARFPNTKTDGIRC